MQHNEMLDNKSRCSGLRGIRARIIQTSSQLSYWCCVAVRRSLLPRDNQLLEMPAWVSCHGTDSVVVFLFA